MLVCSVWVAGAIHARQPLMDPALRDTYPDYVVFSSPNGKDSLGYSPHGLIVPVVFRVNRYDLQPNSLLDTVVQELCRLRSDSAVRVARVWIGGSASPEGPLDWNRRLGEYRSQALARYLSQQTGFPQEQMTVVNLGEDWYSFEQTMKHGMQIPHREEVVAILLREPDAERRKQQIVALDGGRTWHRIIRDLFPPFRNARLAVVCYEQPREILSVPVRLSLYRSAQPASRPVLSSSFGSRRGGAMRPWHLAVKSNLLVLAATVANVGVEVELWPHGSLDIPVFYSPYDITPTRKLRVLATQPELRWWPGLVMQGHFVGLHTHVAGFNIAVNDKGRYQDPNHALWGMGVSYGYALSWGASKQWGVEFTLGVGFAEYDYDVYRNRPGGPLFESGSDWYWGITRAGISLSYKWAFSREK